MGLIILHMIYNGHSVTSLDAMSLWKIRKSIIKHIGQTMNSQTSFHICILYILLNHDYVIAYGDLVY